VSTTYYEYLMRALEDNVVFINTLENVLTYATVLPLTRNVVFLNTLRKLVSQLINVGELRQPLLGGL
jgi:hypothetical protein